MYYLLLLTAGLLGWAFAPLQAQNLPGARAHLESPSEDSFESGIGLIRGWVCDATTVEVQMDSGERWLTAYGTQREDTATVCGDTNNGFGLTFNWNRLGDGPHILRAFADGVEFANVTFNVTTLGQEYLRGASGIYPLFNFPIPNQNIVVSWQESSQNFVIIDSSLRQEAEKALTGSNGSSIFRSRASADAVWHLNNPGDKADYDIQVPVTGNYKLIVRYSNDDTGIGDDIKVYVNGVYKNQFHTQNTRPPGVKLGDGWDIFVNTPVIHLKNLADGYPDGHIEFTFELVSTDGFGVDLDLFSLAPEF